jgi:hypothetical protein
MDIESISTVEVADPRVMPPATALSVTSPPEASEVLNGCFDSSISN